MNERTSLIRLCTNTGFEFQVHGSAVLRYPVAIGRVFASSLRRVALPALIVMVATIATITKRSAVEVGGAATRFCLNSSGWPTAALLLTLNMLYTDSTRTLHVLRPLRHALTLHAITHLIHTAMTGATVPGATCRSVTLTH